MSSETMKAKITAESIEEASKSLNSIVKHTPLKFSKRLSAKYKAKIFLKREDLQEIRSYKIRGAFNFLRSLTPLEKKKGVVAASAGNHAQGIAFSASYLKIPATIFIPTVTSLQKINKIRSFGGKWVTIKQTGKTFDESYDASVKYSKETKAILVHPFDDPDIIIGQGTVAAEIYASLGSEIDYLVCPIGGGGLIAGVGAYLKAKVPKVKIIGAEPQGADSMKQALINKKPVTLENIDTFVDGASVKRVGDLTYKITSQIIESIQVVPPGKICTTMIQLYQNEGIVAEPAGALSIAALDFIAEEIKDKRVVCILSGGNNDILRYPEIMERSLLYEGLKHYFLIQFAQKPGQLLEFLNKVLGPFDDIVRFEYIKKTSKELGPALVGIEFQSREDYPKMLKRMDEAGFNYTVISENDLLYDYLI